MRLLAVQSLQILPLPDSICSGTSYLGFVLDMKARRMIISGVDAAFSCDDIFCNILLRIHPDCLVRLILVSKRWLQFICSSSFRHSYMSHWRVGHNLVGFFVSNTLYLGRPQDGVRRPRSEPAILLLSTSREGDDMKASGMLQKLGYFIDSSCGLLLCGRHPKAYYVWNPVTGERQVLPHPRVYFEEFCMAFVVEDCPDEEICYKVVRAKCECRLEEINTVTLETFWSKTRTWYYSTLSCSSTLSLSPWTVATVVKGVIHWYASRGNIAIYDPVNDERHIGLVKLPGSHDFDAWTLGVSSDGHLQYGGSVKSSLEIWILKLEQADSSTTALPRNSHSKCRWILRHALNFRTMWKKNPAIGTRVVSRSKETEILAFLPHNSESVYIRSGSNLYIYHFCSGKVEIIQYEGRGSVIAWDFSKVVPYFRPAWPQSSLSITDA